MGKVEKEMSHRVAATYRVPDSNQYSNRNHSYLFRCGECGREGRFNTNRLGHAKWVFCDGETFTKLLKESKVPVPFDWKQHHA